MSRDSSSAAHYCNNVASMFPLYVIGGSPVGSAMFAVATMYFVSSLLVIYFIKMKMKVAQQDSKQDSKAARSVIFPVFVDILWANSLINVYVGILLLTFSYDTMKSKSYWPYSIMYALQHMVVEGVAFMLMRKGVGWKAAKDSFWLALLWGVITLFLKLGSLTTGWLPDFETYTLVSYVLNVFWELALLLFYLALWLLPKKLLFRRPAALWYAKFWTLFRVASITINALIYVSQTRWIGNCLSVYGLLLLFSCLEPTVVYFTLLQDSRWWQGLSIVTTVLYSNDRLSIESSESGKNAIDTPLKGVDLNVQSAQSLAAQVDAMSGMGSKSIKLLNFAQITLQPCQLGAGSFSRVYKGLYRQKQCAVKLIYTLDLTEDVIKRVAAEAQILSEIEHPNIVRIFGVSVLPPSVCILLELCHFGSLADLVEGSQGLSLHMADMLFLAWGCSKGLAALHAWSADLCHRDIKSFNFLVDAQLNAKLADLELGTTTKDDKYKDRQRKGLFRVDSFNNDTDLESGIDNIILDKEEILANWMGPEVLMGEAYKQSSDVYSFALVLWEIISGQHPFADIRDQDDIRAMVKEGQRPAIPDTYLDAPPPMNHYVALIERCWQHHPKMRPTADEVASELECIYSNVCYSLVTDTDIFPNISSEDLLKKRGNRLHIWSPATATSQETPDFSGSGLSNMTSSLGNLANATAISSVADNAFVSIERFYEKVEAVIKDPSYELIDRNPSAWLLVTSFAPHIVVRVSSNWSRLSGNNSTNDPETFDRRSSVLGKPLASILVGSKTNTEEWGSFVSSLGTESHRSHTMVTLHTERSRSSSVGGQSGNGTQSDGTNDVSNPLNSTSLRTLSTESTKLDEKNHHLSSEVYGNNYSLFSVHAYPVRTRNAVTVSTNNNGSSFQYISTVDSNSVSQPVSGVGEGGSTTPSTTISPSNSATELDSYVTRQSAGQIGRDSHRFSSLSPNDADGDRSSVTTISVPSDRSSHSGVKSSRPSLFSQLRGRGSSDKELRRPVVLYAVLFHESRGDSELLKHPAISSRREGNRSFGSLNPQKNSSQKVNLKYSNTSTASNGSQTK